MLQVFFQFFEKPMYDFDTFLDALLVGQLVISNLEVIFLQNLRQIQYKLVILGCIKSYLKPF